MDLLVSKSTAEAVTATMITQTRVEEKSIFRFSLKRITVDSLQDQVYIIISQYSPKKMTPNCLRARLYTTTNNDRIPTYKDFVIQRICLYPVADLEGG